MNRAAALLAYLPVPGLGWALAAGLRGDRLVRLHGNQGAVLSCLLLVGLLIVALASGGVRLVLAGILGMGWIAYALTGAYAAARGRFRRLVGPYQLARAGYLFRMREP